jgi:hypothetical protein
MYSSIKTYIYILLCTASYMCVLILRDTAEHRKQRALESLEISACLFPFPRRTPENNGKKRIFHRKKRIQKKIDFYYETRPNSNHALQAHDRVVYRLGALFGSVGHKVKIHKITPATGQERGDTLIFQDNRLPLLER